ncbi:MAG: hypothetical protein M3373_02170 [Gemmatimonadota bacterium]|nr:hypothetical protein [Gemmatimonadota bacterium]
MRECEEDDVIEKIARELRAPVRVDAALDASVMARVRGASPEALHDRPRARATRVWHWVLRPRPVALSPLATAVLAAGIVGAAVVGARLWVALPPAGRVVAESALEGMGAGRAVERPSLGLGGTAGATAVMWSGPGKTAVRFVLYAPAAAAVTVVGDFNEWDAAANPLSASSDGVWSAVVPLPAGRYQYTFLVNGTTWVPDLAAPWAPEDDFGAPNAVVTVAEFVS